MTEKYLDFDLHIAREGDAYRANVRDSPAGKTQNVPLNFPLFRDESPESWLTRLEDAIIKGRAIRGGPMSSHEKILREFGSLVFHAVFDHEPIADLFRRSMIIAREKTNITGLRLKLALEPPELALLPWEYIAANYMKAHEGAPQQYLCLDDVSPLVRYLDGAVRPRNTRINGPLRILGMISNPNIPGRNHFDIGRERLKLDAVLAKSDQRVHFEWLTGGTRDDLCNAMQSGGWHVFHFVGHGGTELDCSDGRTDCNGYVFMEDQHCNPVRVYADDLVNALSGNNDLQLAVLNCCDSGRGSSFSSPGARLVLSGVPLAIAMQFAISDESASAFATRFYQALFQGLSVERAMTRARCDVHFQSRVEWGIPVLFTHIDSSVCFNINAKQQPVTQRTPDTDRKLAARAALRELMRPAGAAL